MCRVDNLTPEEDKHEIAYTPNELRKISQTAAVEGTETEALAKKQTASCCACFSTKKAQTVDSKATTFRRGSIKQAGVLSNVKPEPLSLK